MKILNRLTIKHLTLNKKRTITTIIGICLSTALMVGIGLLCSTVRENVIKTSIKDDGRYMVKFYDINSNDISLMNNNLISDYYYYHHLGYSKLENVTNENKPFIDVILGNDTFLKELTLIDGRLPQNENEVIIPEHLIKDGKYNVKIGDTITLNVGDFKFYEDIDNTIETETKKYKVVGICERYATERYYSIGYQIYTNGTFDDTEITLFVNMKNPNDTYKVGKSLTNLFKIDEEEEYERVTYNDYLLSWYGVSRYDNIIGTISTILSIVLGLVSIGCIIVIYNSFAISVMERKKQFGLFSSIGTTRKQLRHTVFFEALVVGSIGIILGLLGAYVGIGTVIFIVNKLLSNVFSVPLTLCTYPLFIIIPLIFIVITIIISAFIPAFKASKVSPISAIKQHDDIKIKGKKVKTGKWARKLFGIEGEIALKNIKRNKKKYRITIASLFISIVLFISFSSLLQYGFGGINEYADITDFNHVIRYATDNDDTSKLEEIRNHYQVDDSILIKEEALYISKFNESYMIDSQFPKKLHLNDDEGYSVNILTLSDKDYNDLLKKYNVNNGTSFLINKYKYISYENNSRKKKQGKIFNDKFDGKISICEDDYSHYVCNYNLDNILLIDEVPFGLESFIKNNEYIIITNSEVSSKIYQTYYEEESQYIYQQLLISANEYDDLDNLLDEMQNNDNMFSYENIEESMKLIKNLILVLKILLYGFIGLVTLIGVTSVFNTINTSINLRRKEFAMLRSMGLSPKGFNKMLSFESLFFGIKSLLYSLPVSIGISYLLYKTMTDMVDFEYALPWKYMLFATIGVFIIVFITMMYSSSKIKHENILEAIREENI